MPITAQNIKPGVLPSTYMSKTDQPFDLVEKMRSVLCPTFRTPLVPSAPVVIDKDGQPFTDGQIIATLINCCGNSVQQDCEDDAKVLFHNALMHYDPNTNLNAREIYALQAGTAAKLTEPSQIVYYTADMDVIPVCKQFMGGACDYNKFFATIAYFTRVQALGFYFMNEQAFENFKTFLGNAAQQYMAANRIGPNAQKLLNDFQNLRLNMLTETLTVRNDPSDGNDPDSFARILIEQLMQFTVVNGPGESGVMPFDLLELFTPQHLIFFNVERHSVATKREIMDEWDIIKQALDNPIKMISNAQLCKTTTVPRAARKSAAAAVTSGARLSAKRSADVIKFKAAPPTKVDLARYVKLLSDKQGRVNKSGNIYKEVTMTFNKPNRRDPDNFNLQGKSVSTRYKPDIHLYVDTSGSISERNYIEAIYAAIMVARKNNVDLYFNSFADGLSQTTRLHTRNKSVQQIYAEFKKIVKVTGGTDYVPIWQYINQVPRAQREIALCITDFEWSPPNKFVKHPQNLYYVPCGQTDYNRIKRSAEQFIKAMRHIDPDIRKRVLM